MPHLTDCYNLVEPKDKFSHGFIAGQMEKVYTGACQMVIIPRIDDNAIFVCNNLKVYPGLGYYVTLAGEIWIYDEKIDKIIDVLIQLRPGPAYHIIRGLLCGIKDIDPYHETRNDQKDPR